MTSILRGRGGGRSWPSVLEQWGDYLPRYPSFDHVPVAKLPAPPKLKKKSTADEHLVHLAKSFRSVVTEWFGPCNHYKLAWCAKRFCDVDDAEDIDRSLVVALETARDLLLSRDVSPIAWCAFSCVIWEKTGARYRGRVISPSVKWVYSKKRIVERQDWFVWYQSMFRGGRLMLEPLHRELIVRYERMRYRLMSEEVLNEGKVLGIVEDCLPEDFYQRALRKLEEDSEERQRSIQHAIKNFEWVW